jgi:hypothetical protein
MTNATRPPSIQRRGVEPEALGHREDARDGRLVEGHAFRALAGFQLGLHLARQPDPLDAVGQRDILDTPSAEIGSDGLQQTLSLLIIARNSLRTRRYCAVTLLEPCQAH